MMYKINLAGKRRGGNDTALESQLSNFKILDQYYD